MSKKFKKVSNALKFVLDTFRMISASFKTDKILFKKYGERFNDVVNSKSRELGKLMHGMEKDIYKHDKTAFNKKNFKKTTERLAEALSPFIEGKLKLPGKKEKLVDKLVKRARKQLLAKHGKVSQKM